MDSSTSTGFIYVFHNCPKCDHSMISVSPVDTITISIKCGECRRTFKFTYTDKNSHPLTPEGAAKLGIIPDERTRQEV